MTIVKRGFLGVLLILTILLVEVAAHEVRIPVIVDTDMALDDVRALALMLNSPHIQVKAVVSSDGSSSPQAGYQNLLRVLQYLSIAEVLVGVGKGLDQPAPHWRSMSEALGWADLPAAPSGGAISDATSVILATVSESEDKIFYVCLGPLTNLAETLRLDPSLKDKIERVFYYGTPPEVANPSWNTTRDLDAARLVFSLRLPIYAFHLDDPDLMRFDMDFYQEIQGLHSRSSVLIDLLHRDRRVQALLEKGHFRVWDEMVALYLDNPSLGDFQAIQGDYPAYFLSAWDRDAARSAYIEILSGRIEADLDPRVPVVLIEYPTSPKYFREDLRHLIPEIITLHGLEEWKACLLTNELHRHLGIYSILGAKMGLRAREILGASLDELKVESHAGLKPPLSCINDGLQVATGASLGRGTIKVLEKGSSPAATFIYGRRRLYLCVKEEILKRLRSDIQRAILRYGSLTPMYFQEVRRLSLQYWVGMDRRKIFNAVMQGKPPEQEYNPR